MLTETIWLRKQGTDYFDTEIIQTTDEDKTLLSIKNAQYRGHWYASFPDGSYKFIGDTEPGQKLNVSEYITYE